jgi:pRiA4b ORF-3-like protein
MDVYAIKVTLLGTRPPVWRRFLVERDITLHQLHRTLQVVMGWTNSHLHQFVFQKQKQSERTKLGDLIAAPGTTLLYEYDFGDGWQHELRLEEILIGDASFQKVCVREPEPVRRRTAEDRTVMPSFSKQCGTLLIRSTIRPVNGSVNILIPSTLRSSKSIRSCVAGGIQSTTRPGDHRPRQDDTHAQTVH